ncbi:hypothetical protein BDW66DRAFT_147208 [Aspergillus desertorum]
MKKLSLSSWSHRLEFEFSNTTFSDEPFPSTFSTAEIIRQKPQSSLVSRWNRDWQRSDHYLLRVSSLVSWPDANLRIWLPRFPLEISGTPAHWHLPLCLSVSSLLICSRPLSAVVSSVFYSPGHYATGSPILSVQSTNRLQKSA